MHPYREMKVKLSKLSLFLALSATIGPVSGKSKNLLKNNQILFKFSSYYTLDKKSWGIYKLVNEKLTLNYKNASRRTFKLKNKAGNITFKNRKIYFIHTIPIKDRSNIVVSPLPYKRKKIKRGQYQFTIDASNLEIISISTKLHQLKTVLAKNYLNTKSLRGGKFTFQNIKCQKKKKYFRCFQSVLFHTKGNRPILLARRGKSKSKKI